MVKEITYLIVRSYDDCCCMLSSESSSLVSSWACLANSRLALSKLRTVKTIQDFSQMSGFTINILFSTLYFVAQVYDSVASNHQYRFDEYHFSCALFEYNL